MAYIPRYYVTHKQKVQRLYKKALREIENWNHERHQIRIQSVLLREKFEEHRHITDPIMARKVLKSASTYVEYISHPEPRKFPTSFDGVAWERYEQKPDDVCLDFWHPLERAQYPDYFAKREQRKKEFVEWYNKKYGKPAFKYYPVYH